MKKFLLGFGVTVALAVSAALVAFYFFPHVLWINWARYSMPEEKYELLYEKPIERNPRLRPGVKAGISTHHSFEYGDLVFQTVWPKANKQTKEKERTTILFPGQKELILLESGDLHLKEDMINLAGDAEMAERVFGREVLENEFAIHRAVIEVSLNDTPRNPADMGRMMILTIFKSMLPPEPSSPIYSFETPHIRGWQFGRPGGKNVIHLIFFDRQDAFYQIVATGMKQGEIDVIIDTTRDHQTKRSE